MKTLLRAAVVALTVAVSGAAGGTTAAAQPGVAADIEHYLVELEASTRTPTTLSRRRTTAPPPTG